MKSVEVGENVHIAVGGQFPYCNSLVILSDENAIIDPGCSLEGLRTLLRMHSLDLKDIDVIMLSHIHPDHITHAARINRLSRCRIVANEITAPLFSEKEKMKQFLGFHKGQNIRPHWEALVNERMFGAFDDAQIDVVVRDGESYKIGEIELRMIYTPGHLPDHMCIEVVNENLLFAADIDCSEFGPFYGHPNSSIPEFKASIEMIKNMEFRGIISGHLEEPLLKDYRPALASYLRQFDIREDLINIEISGGARSVDEIIVNPVIYPSTSNLVFMQFEKWMIEHHILSLIQKGLVWEHKGRLQST